MIRIRPSTRADRDVFLTESLVRESGTPRSGGLVLERFGAALALVDYGLGHTRIARGKMGWVVEDDETAASSPCVWIDGLYAARRSTVQEVSPLLRAVQNVALERAIEWVVAVPVLGIMGDLCAYQTALQRAEIRAPMCGLLWELGFIDLISRERLDFVWRNPAF